MSDRDLTPVNGVPVYLERRLQQIRGECQDDCQRRHERSNDLGHKALRLTVEARELLLDTIGKDGSRWKRLEETVLVLKESATKSGILRDVLIILATAVVTAALSAGFGHIF